MKKIIFSILVLFTVFAYSQKRPVRTDFLRIDTLTTVQRDLIPADLGKAQYIFNIDNNRLEERKPGGSWEAFSGVGGGGTWGSITGTLSDQTDLQTALDSKVYIDPGSSSTPIGIAYNTTANLDALPAPSSGIRLEFQSDPDDPTDGYVTSAEFTGTGTKTLTLTRNGLPDITASFNDDGGTGTGDGNDYVTAFSLSGTVLTAVIPNQVDPSIDLSVLQDGSGVTDHGDLTGLADDDHPQYMTQAESDSRYLQTEVDGSTTNEIQTISKTGSTVTLSNGGGSFTDDNTQLSTEQVQDISGTMVSGNTEIGIAVTYQDADGTIDFVASDTSPTNEIQTISKSGSTVTLSNGGGSFTDSDTQLSTEQVQDIAGAMVSGNTETNISVVYQDTDGTIDFNIIDGPGSGLDADTVDGVTFSETATPNTLAIRNANGHINVATDPYDSGWGASQQVPTKADLYTKIESIASGNSAIDMVTNTSTPDGSGFTVVDSERLSYVVDGDKVSFTLEFRDVDGSFTVPETGTITYTLPFSTRTGVVITPVTTYSTIEENSSGAVIAKAWVSGSTLTYKYLRGSAAGNTTLVNSDIFISGTIITN